MGRLQTSSTPASVFRYSAWVNALFPVLFNAQQPTSNIQVGAFSEDFASRSLIAYCRVSPLRLGRWLLGVGCWMFDSLPCLVSVGANPGKTWSAVAESEASLRVQDVDTAFASCWGLSLRTGKRRCRRAWEGPLPPHSKSTAPPNAKLNAYYAHPFKVAKNLNTETFRP